jgi:NAD(P)-dependent dehydrogenase (short-subunit alcohol dehydrogenase family)
VTDQDQVIASVQAAKANFGGVDVLVNKSGIGYFGAVEESGDNDVRSMFETNFWGLANMTRAVLPVTRQARRGTIVNMSSMCGVRGAAGVGQYNASKFVAEGFSEALSQEVAPLGIKVLLVETSGSRTDWAGRTAKEVNPFYLSQSQ